jgi:crotonobetainyl-CoA:carnitine CoA-transferase CaiB-like acyl-CoA transferase
VPRASSESDGPAATRLARALRDAHELMNENERREPAARAPLAGVRVIDLSQIAAGPYCTSMLGDFGADVVKVEPTAGDPLRSIDDAFGPGESAYFFGLNRSKRALAIDLKSEAGRSVLDRLLATADVCVVSMRPAALARLHLTHEELAARHPRLVYCLITAFGETGPRADEPGMDILAQALGGIMGLTGEPGRAPVKAGVPVADFVGSVHAVLGILLALRVRDRDGFGQKVSINLLDGQVSLLANYVALYCRNGKPIRPVGGGHPQIVPYQVFEASDGPFIVACLTERFWPPLCEAIGRPELARRTEFATNVARVQHRDELVPMLAAVFATRHRAHWLERLRAQDIPVSPVHRLEDVIAEPQVVHNGMLLDLVHPRHGPVRTVNNPVHLSRTPAQPSRYPPALGEHTEELMAELGFDAAEVARLRGLGAIA